jgi:hypothetical protein
MQTARRLYVYLLSGISLGVLVAGVSMLLSVLLDRLGLGAPVFAEQGDVIGQRLTLASALTVVGLPVWLIHWTAAERSVRPERPDAALERTSDIRGLYFALAMGILLIVAATAIGSIIGQLVAEAAGADAFGDLASDVALVVVAGTAWAYHLWIRTRDWARGPMTGGGAWLPRTYLYLAAFVGLVALLNGVGDLVEVIARAIFNQPPEFSDPGGSWWGYPLGQALSAVIVGGGVWLGHATYASRLIRDPDWRGAEERPARLRVAYFVAVIVATAGGTLFYLGEGLGAVLAVSLGIGVDGDQLPIIVLVALFGAAPFAAAWWLHVSGIREEADALEVPERGDAADRLVLYGTALVGLAFAATAVAVTAGLLLDLLVGGSRVLGGGDAVRDQLVRAVPFALLGLVSWAWAWRRVGMRASADPEAESASTVRRAMLLLTLAGSVIAGVIAAAIVLYRLFGGLFGVEQGGDAIAEMTRPFAALVVAVLVATYHGVQLRHDQGRRAEVAARMEAAAPAPAPTPAVEATVLALRLSGPAGGDLVAVAERLRGSLPPGFQLELMSSG